MRLTARGIAGFKVPERKENMMSLVALRRKRTDAFAAEIIRRHTEMGAFAFPPAAMVYLLLAEREAAGHAFRAAQLLTVLNRIELSGVRSVAARAAESRAAAEKGAERSGHRERQDSQGARAAQNAFVGRPEREDAAKNAGNVLLMRTERVVQKSENVFLERTVRQLAQELRYELAQAQGLPGPELGQLVQISELLLARVWGSSQGAVSGEAQSGRLPESAAPGQHVQMQGTDVQELEGMGSERGVRTAQLADIDGSGAVWWEAMGRDLSAELAALRARLGARSTQDVRIVRTKNTLQDMRMAARPLPDFREIWRETVAPCRPARALLRYLEQMEPAQRQAALHFLGERGETFLPQLYSMRREQWNRFAAKAAGRLLQAERREEEALQRQADRQFQRRDSAFREETRRAFGDSVFQGDAQTLPVFQKKQQGVSGGPDFFDVTQALSVFPGETGSVSGVQREMSASDGQPQWPGLFLRAFAALASEVGGMRPQMHGVGAAARQEGEKNSAQNMGEMAATSQAQLLSKGSMKEAMQLQLGLQEAAEAPQAQPTLEEMAANEPGVLESASGFSATLSENRLAASQEEDGPEVMLPVPGLVFAAQLREKLGGMDTESWDKLVELIYKNRAAEPVSRRFSQQLPGGTDSAVSVARAEAEETIETADRILTGQPQSAGVDAHTDEKTRADGQQQLTDVRREARAEEKERADERLQSTGVVSVEAKMLAAEAESAQQPVAHSRDEEQENGFAAYRRLPEAERLAYRPKLNALLAQMEQEADAQFAEAAFGPELKVPAEQLRQLVSAMGVQEQRALASQVFRMGDSARQRFAERLGVRQSAGMTAQGNAQMETMAAAYPDGGEQQAGPVRLVQAEDRAAVHSDVDAGQIVPVKPVQNQQVFAAFIGLLAQQLPGSLSAELAEKLTEDADADGAERRGGLSAESTEKQTKPSDIDDTEFEGNFGAESTEKQTTVTVEEQDFVEIPADEADSSLVLNTREKTQQGGGNAGTELPFSQDQTTIPTQDALREGANAGTFGTSSVFQGNVRAGMLAEALERMDVDTWDQLVELVYANRNTEPVSRRFAEVLSEGRRSEGKASGVNSFTAYRVLPEAERLLYREELCTLLARMEQEVASGIAVASEREESVSRTVVVLEREENVSGTAAALEREEGASRTVATSGRKQEPSAAQEVRNLPQTAASQGAANGLPVSQDDRMSSDIVASSGAADGLSASQDGRTLSGTVASSGAVDGLPISQDDRSLSDTAVSSGAVDGAVFQNDRTLPKVSADLGMIRNLLAPQEAGISPDTSADLTETDIFSAVQTSQGQNLPGTTQDLSAMDEQTWLDFAERIFLKVMPVRIKTDEKMPRGLSESGVQLLEQFSEEPEFSVSGGASAQQEAAGRERLSGAADLLEKREETVHQETGEGAALPSPGKVFAGFARLLVQQLPGGMPITEVQEQEEQQKQEQQQKQRKQEEQQEQQKEAQSDQSQSYGLPAAGKAAGGAVSVLETAEDETSQLHETGSFFDSVNAGELAEAVGYMDVSEWDHLVELVYMHRSKEAVSRRFAEMLPDGSKPSAGGLAAYRQLPTQERLAYKTQLCALLGQMEREATAQFAEAAFGPELKVPAALPGQMEQEEVEQRAEAALGTGPQLTAEQTAQLLYRTAERTNEGEKRFSLGVVEETERVAGVADGNGYPAERAPEQMERRFPEKILLNFARLFASGGTGEAAQNGAENAVSVETGQTAMKGKDRFSSVENVKVKSAEAALRKETTALDSRFAETEKRMEAALWEEAVSLDSGSTEAGQTTVETILRKLSAYSAANAPEAGENAGSSALETGAEGLSELVGYMDADEWDGLVERMYQNRQLEFVSREFVAQLPDAAFEDYAGRPEQQRLMYKTPLLVLLQQIARGQIDGGVPVLRGDESAALPRRVLKDLLRLTRQPARVQGRAGLRMRSMQGERQRVQGSVLENEANPRQNSVTADGLIYQLDNAAGAETDAGLSLGGGVLRMEHLAGAGAGPAGGAETLFPYRSPQMVITRALPPSPKAVPPVPQVLGQTAGQGAEDEDGGEADISFASRKPSFTTAMKEYKEQMHVLSEQLSEQTEQLKKLQEEQVKLVRRTDTEQMTAQVLSRLQSQLRLEKMRRGL